MRLKHVKGAEEAIIESPYIINDPMDHCGRWAEVFGNSNPVHIEIGMGKGQFITALALRNPDINYIGIEKFSSVLIRGVQKQEELQLKNLWLIRIDAENLEDVFAPGEVDRIYLNFSDPWPKDRHAKRRLTSPRFLARYAAITTEDGQVEFKTDNMILFDYSVEAVRESCWEISAITRDLHGDPAMNVGNIMTEYEERFSAKGNPIGKLILRKKQA